MAHLSNQQRDLRVSPTAEGTVALEIWEEDGAPVYACELTAEDARWLGNVLVRAARLAEQAKES